MAEGRRPLLLLDAHAQLFAAQLLALKPSESVHGVHMHCGRGVRRAVVLGRVVSVLLTKKFTLFAVDDGSGCVPCLLWTAPNADGVDVQAPPAGGEHAYAPQVGDLLRVKGRITSYSGQVQLSCTSCEVVTDPNEELLHWMDVMSLAAVPP